MIISHEHRFIFLKTKKTAGTALELALSTTCGPRDIITPVSPDDERKRVDLGGTPPQNYHAPWSAYSPAEMLKFVFRKRRKMLFWNHISAAEVRERVEPGVWSTYFRFAFARHPVDQVVSMYHWNMRRREHPPSLDEYVEHALPRVRAGGWGVYAIDDQIAVDRVFRYEDLPGALAEISDRLNVTLPMLPQAKSGLRRGEAPLEVAPAVRDRITAHFRPEMDLLGYS